MKAMRKLSACAVFSALLLNSGLSHATDVYSRKTTASVPLSASGGVPVTLLSVNIPSGSWKVTAKYSPVNFGVADYVRCFVTSATATASVQIDSATSYIGGNVYVATMANVGVINTAATTTFRLQCQHDGWAGAGLYVDPDAKLVVERVSSGVSIL